MSENKDVYTQAKSQMRLSERIVAALPGFKGYHEKELRRESDRLIRNHLTLKLSNIKDNVRSIFQKITDRRYLDVLSDMDRLTAKIDRVTEKVNHASYGYSGFFDVIKVKEENLDRMIAFDNQLVDYINALAVAVDTFKSQLTAGDYSELKDKIQTVTDKLEALENAFDNRKEVIMGVIQ
jgi:septation ring formation regulator EzrA